MGLQLEGHCAIIVNPMQRFKQALEVDHPITRGEMQVIRGGIAPAVVVEMNVLNSLRESINEA